MAALRVQLLGSAGATVGASDVVFSPDMRYQGLAYLAFREAWVPREKLAFLFWPDTTTREARHNLRQLLKRMRKLDWLTGLEADRHRVRWRVDTDVRRFADAARDGRRTDALRLYRGPLLEGLGTGRSGEYDAWLAHERRRLHDTWRGLLLAHARAWMQQGAPDRAVRTLAAYVARHPLDEDALRAYMRALAQAGGPGRALEAFRRFAKGLRHELDVAPSSATVELAEGIRDAGTVAAPAPIPPAPNPGPSAAGPAAANRLPSPATPFVGRDLELGHISHLLTQESCRLLTLTGPGGVGKSRLAQAAAEELAPRYPGGVHAVALESVSDAGALPHALATMLGAELDEDGDAAAQLATRIGGDRTLLVLDNFEHLVDGAELVSALIEACPALDVLVTSRARLRLRRERLFPIAGLSRPPPDTATPEDAESYDAVRMFVQAVCRVRPRFVLRRRELPIVLDVLRQIAGMPLGIELVAAWSRSMPLEDVAAKLASDPELLASRDRDRPARHRSMRTVFERSWELLAREERRVLSTLTVFRGGFRSDAASAVSDAPSAVLAGLVDASLLQFDATGRYRLHPLFRGYAEEKLSDGERARARARHAEHYVRVLESLDQEVRRGREADALRRIDREWDNLRSAMRWCASRPDPARLRTCLELMNQRFERRGSHREALELLDLAADRLDPDENEHRRTLGRVFLKAGWYHQRVGAYDRAETRTRRGLEIAREFREHAWVAWGMNTLGAVADRRGSYAKAQKHFERALELGRSAGDDEVCAAVLDNLAQTHARAGAYAPARRGYEEALALYEEMGMVTGEVSVLNNLGSLHGELRELDAAERCFDRAYELARDIGDDRIALYLLINLGSLAHDRGRFVRAQELSEKALGKTRELRERHLMAPILSLAARAAASLGDPAAAEKGFRDAIRSAWDLGDVPEALGALEGLAELLATRGDAARAVPILHALLRHPATGAREREDAGRTLAELDPDAWGRAPSSEATVGDAESGLGEVVRKVLG